MIECSRCGNEFNPDREPKRPGMDTSRCSSCGQKHDPTQERTTTIEADGATVRITIEVLPATDR